MLRWVGHRDGRLRSGRRRSFVPSALGLLCLALAICLLRPEAAFFAARPPALLQEELEDLKELAAEGNIDECLKRSQAVLQEADEETSKALHSLILDSYAAAGDYAAAKRWLSDLIASGGAVDPQGLARVAERAARDGEAKEAAEWLCRVRDASTRTAGGESSDADADGDAPQEEGLSVAGVSCLQACAPAALSDFVLQAARAGLSTQDLGLDTVLGQLCRESRLSEADRLLTTAVDQGLTPSQVSFSMLVDAHSAAGDQAAAQHWAQQMRGVTGAQLTTAEDYNEIIAGCCRSGQPDGAVAWFRAMQSVKLDPDSASYAGVIGAFRRAEDPGGAAWWLSKMKEVGFEPTADNYADVVTACAKAGQASTALRWVDEMEAVGMAPTPQCFNALILACAKNGDTTRAVQWLGKMKSAGHSPDKFSYTEVVQSFARKGDLKGARQWFQNMQEAGVEPDVVSYTAVISACAKLGMPEEAEKLLREMQKASLKPDAMAFTWVIIAHMKNKKRARSFSNPELIFRNMVKSGVTPTNFTIDVLDRAVGPAKRSALCQELGIESGVKVVRVPAKKKKVFPKKLGPYHDGGPEVKVFRGAVEGAQMGDCDMTPEPYGEDPVPKHPRDYPNKKVKRRLGFW